MLAYCDNTGGEPLAWMLRKGSAGSNTAADHIAITDAAIAALPPAFRRNLMITLHAAARLVRGGRRRRWKFAANWPWTEAITRAWQRICALPDTT